MMGSEETDQEKKYVFKFHNFRMACKGSNKKKGWRSIKQIITIERGYQWPSDATLYYSINAPPSFKPNKKYSDISGLLAPYTDPYSKLLYANCEEYATIQSLPMDISAGYLQLRGASSVI